jgi:hypothetical protein
MSAGTGLLALALILVFVLIVLPGRNASASGDSQRRLSNGVK